VPILITLTPGQPYARLANSSLATCCPAPSSLNSKRYALNSPFELCFQWGNEPRATYGLPYSEEAYQNTDLHSSQKFTTLEPLAKLPTGTAGPRDSLSGNDFCREGRCRGRAANLMALFVSLGATTTLHHRMHSGRRGNTGGHSRNRINWSAVSARIPNIKCAITLASPLTMMVLPPNSSLSRALLRSATVRSL
jgi:hypothetical protein